MTATTPQPESDSSAAQGSRALPACLRAYPSQIEEFIRKNLYNLDLEGLSAGVEYQLNSGGKRLRPAMSLWFARALGASVTDVLPVATAVELLHNVFLVQDDIQDGDTYRRGIPTLWRQRGVAEAINVADFLLAEAYSLVLHGGVHHDERPRASALASTSRVQILEAFTSTFRQTVEGQALDVAGRAAADFDLDRYHELVRKKTGRYLALTWVGAALVAAIPSDEIGPLWDLGDQLGPAFQMCDDLLDLDDAKGRGGERGCDIREGKPSVLFAYAMSSPHVTTREKSRLIAVLRAPREATTEADVNGVMELYRRCGAVEFAAAEARRLADAGIAAFETIPYVSAPTATEFRSIAEFVVNRKV